MKKFLPSRGIETLGRLCGLAVAAGADYVLVPKLVEQTGQMAIAVVIGLLFGAMVMFACGAVSQRIADAMRKKQGKRRAVQARRLSSTTRVFTLLMVLTVLAMLLSELLPPASFK
jgi:uncharacterized membrane protein